MHKLIGIPLAEICEKRQFQQADRVAMMNVFFDKEDYEFQLMVNKTMDSDLSQSAHYKPTSYMSLHPHGIVELTTSHALRIAHAVINLLDSLEIGHVEDRLHALRALHDEVLHSATNSFRYNTGRVLIQIMKNIVRARHDTHKQLCLIHDFRRAASGNPRVVRNYLAEYNLLEMPEAWNQLAMDHHVHDANTKGRKNPTHLIMDAWVKGIRSLTVVYYNYIEPNAAKELLEAAKIMGIAVQIGLEFSSRFRDKPVRFMWIPHGIDDTKALLSFLEAPATVALMDAGREASKWMERHVLHTLNHWNKTHRASLARELGITLPPLHEDAFLTFVGMGQASYLHLAEYIHKTVLPLLEKRAQEIHSILADENSADTTRHSLEELLKQLDCLTPEVLLEHWIKPESVTPLAAIDNSDTPFVLRLPPQDLLTWLAELRSTYCITLQLANLTQEDVLELLWDCEGMITHLELFNFKEWQEGHLTNLEDIGKLQQAINEGSALQLKQIIRSMLCTMEARTSNAQKERCEKFRTILRNIPTLQRPYKTIPLGEYIGTDSTSHANYRHGMGLVVPATLPPKARAALTKHSAKPMPIPIRLSLALNESYTESKRSTAKSAITRFLQKIPGCQKMGLVCTSRWHATAAKICPLEEANVFTMDGIAGVPHNNLLQLQPSKKNATPKRPSLLYLNTSVANILRVLFGFIPAMAAFIHTQEWWFLAFFGAVIWFAITGLRNIAQAVLGGGGLGQSSLLRWNNYVNWTRLCDSLMYTGWSVVLLEWGIRSTLLDKTLGFTVSNHYLLIFTIIAMANGLYIATHNIFRGFPKEAVIGNLFRSVLAIPIAVVYFDLLVWILLLSGMDNPDVWLQPGSAIITKAASDTIAGLIEGFADKRHNRRLREWDYKTKLAQLFDCYSKLELAFPEHDILYLLARPQKFVRLISSSHKDMQRAVIINALDLLYFWYYLPYAQQTLKTILPKMTREERVILARSQLILVRIRTVSQLFVDGLLGKKFARALSLYLDRHEDYIQALNKICAAPQR